MIFFHVALFAALLMGISYRTKEELVDVIPCGVCILVLALYGLCFVNGLAWLDILSVLGCFVALFLFFRKPRQERDGILRACAAELKKPGSVTAIVLLTAAVLLTSAKTVTWWDDYNFWAADVKSIFYLNGFAQKYQNVAPEFGDYPPGTQMMKWWFAHFHSSEFREGLMFAGYYFMNLAFLVPLLKFVKRRKVLLMILTGAALWLFPSCVEVFGYDGCCADLTMAVIYGAFLASVVDRTCSRPFACIRQTLYLMVLVLCKNIAPLWAAFALAFAFGYHFLVLKRRERTGRERWYLLAQTFLPVLTECSWLLFCLMRRRVAKLTGTALHMAAGSINIPEVKKELVDAFVTAFVRFPLHRWSTPAVDLSPLALYLLLLLFVFLLCKRGRIEKKPAWFLGIFLGISGICFYGINLVSHLTIFAAETQYLEPFAMVSSIERYGAPFTIGSLYLLAFLAMGGEKGGARTADGKKWPKEPKRQYAAGPLLCLAFVFLTADYQSAYRGLIGYRSMTAQSLKERADIVDEAAGEFLEQVGGGEYGSIGRVLYLRDISDVSWVRNTYISFEASPVSVMYGNVDAGTMGPEEILAMLEDAHAGYLYADEVDGGVESLKALTRDGSFDFGCLYQVAGEAGNRYLVKVG